MPAQAKLVRLAAASISLALGLGSGAAGAQPSPVVAPRDPVVAPRPSDPVTLDAGVRIGGAARLGDAPNFAISSRSGVVLGLGVAIAPTPRFSLGLAYEHSDIGSEHAQGDAATVDLDRSLDSLWATVRLNLFRADWFALGVTLGPGLVWQHVEANVIVYGGTAGVPDAYRCSDSAAVGLGLRAGLGAEAHLGGGFVLSADAVLDELRLSGDPIGACAPGAGSTALFGGRAGLAYRFDVSRFVR